MRIKNSKKKCYCNLCFEKKYFCCVVIEIIIVAGKGRVKKPRAAHFDIYKNVYILCAP